MRGLVLNINVIYIRKWSEGKVDLASNVLILLTVIIESIPNKEYY